MMMSFNSCSVRFPKRIKSQHNTISLKRINTYNTSFLGNNYSINQVNIDNTDDDEIYIKEVSYDKKREMIIDFAELNKEVDALQIADSLQLDVFEVNDIMVQLIKEGILKEL